MKNLNFEFYKRPNDHVEFQEFLDKLNKKDRAKMLAIIYEISIHGISVGIQQNWVKFIDTNLYEDRSKVGKNQQRGLYFHVTDNKFIITHDFTKKTQKTPMREIKHAKDLCNEYFKYRKKD
ncbi:type II toxin-antitoxin system RelE/ParE family toxin [Lactobacillus helveticus]|uniref:type II toxin-antitoxin system RelE/ParE family toxin n=1 Tax=Lactobacillus helveticus TaxID=1587 RepID=UPI0030CB2235